MNRRRLSILGISLVLVSLVLACNWTDGRARGVNATMTHAAGEFELQLSVFTLDAMSTKYMATLQAIIGTPTPVPRILGD